MKITSLAASILLVLTFSTGCAVFAPDNAPSAPLSFRPGAPGHAMAGSPNDGWKPFATPPDNDVVSTVPLNAPASDANATATKPAAEVKVPPSTTDSGPSAVSLLGLPPLNQSVVIKSNPAGATVSLNGKVVGLTPLEVTLNMYNIYDLTVKLDGYQTFTETLQAYTEGVGSGGAKPGMAVANVRRGFTTPMSIVLAPVAR